MTDNVPSMAYFEAVWTVEAALNFAYRRSQGAFENYYLDSIYISLDNPDIVSFDGNHIRQLFLDIKETIDQNTTGIEFGGVAHVDITPVANKDWVVTVVFATPDPVSNPIPSIGDWLAIEDKDCQNNSYPCAIGGNAASKTAALINSQYYFDLFNSQGINPSFAHFHTGIYSVGTGYTGLLKCWRNFSVDRFISGNPELSNWPLYGYVNSPSTYGGYSKCIYGYEIELFASLITAHTNIYNPTDQKRVFFYEMGVDITLSIPPEYWWSPAVFKFGNFHYVSQTYTLSGY